MLSEDCCPDTGKGDCQMCSGEFCRQCIGGGGSIDHPCEHSVDERHTLPRIEEEAGSA